MIRHVLGLALWLPLAFFAASPPVSAQTPVPVTQETAPAKAKPAAAPAKKPAKKPAKAAPIAPAAAEAAPVPKGEAQAPESADPLTKPPPPHSLQGDWKVFWLNDNKVTRLNVVQVSPGAGVTSFIGAISKLDGEACTLNGTVLDALAGQYAAGPETREIAISAYVIIRAQCSKGQVWIEAFGFPSGKILLSGRASFIPAEGARSYAPVALGR